MAGEARPGSRVSRPQGQAALAIVGAVSSLWWALFRHAPAYPPPLDSALASAGGFFLCALVLGARVEPQRWPALARFGFVMSAAGLVLWMAGGVMSTFAVWPRGLEALWGRVAFDLLARPQVGWGLFAVGLIPIGLAAVIRQLSPPPRMLLPIGGLFLLGPLVKYLLGEQIGGSTIFVAFGCGWLLVAVQLLRSSQASAAEVPSR